MKSILLDRLLIENFKGCRRLELNFRGRGASIYGDNAAGKTTVYDALTWLLFGKDSRGQSNFDIKPLSEGGEVLDHAAVTAVEAALLEDGALLTLRKTYFERWSSKRGGAEVFDGHTSEYFVDGVPSKKYVFEERVAALIPEERFRMLTGVNWFCQGLDWRSRRAALFDVCGSASDGELLAGDERFAPLAAGAGALPLEQYRAKLTAERKGLNGARNTIPARLDEQRQTIEALAGVDFGALRRERDTKAARLDRLTAELMKLDHGALLDAKRNELSALENELAACVNKNERHRQSQTAPVVDRRPALEADIQRAEREFTRWTGLASNEKRVAEELARKVEACRAEWAAEEAKAFSVGPCPTCGQTLPASLLETARARFEAERETRKASIVAQADREKAALRDAEGRREQYITEAVAAENEAARLKAELAACVPEAQPEIEDLPEFAERAAELEGGIQALREEVSRLAGESAAIREEITGKVDALWAEVDRLGRELAKEGSLEFARRREEELRREARRTAEALEALDRQLVLCEEFTRYKSGKIEEGVNGRFRLVRFKLFDRQVNGGLADCCEATVGGVPYSSLNSGARINAGLDVIRALSDHYGVQVPLFIDNAESVTELLDADTQVIRLVVSGADKELRCEYGA